MKKLKKIIVGSLALLICDGIRKHFPNMPILAMEERSRRDAVQAARIARHMDTTVKHPPQRIVFSRTWRNPDGTVNRRIDSSESTPIVKSDDGKSNPPQ
jgi:hypothetical protein